MKPDRTPPMRFYNRRMRKLAQAFELALASKVRRETEREAFEAQYAPTYRNYGRRVEAADRARAERKGPR